MRLEATLPPGVTIPVDTYNVLAISRDGSRVAIVGATDGVNRIYLRTLSDFEARPLAGTEGAAEPFFSPDGAWIGFLSNNNSLKKISVDGGLVVTLAAAGSVRGAVWNDADNIIYAATGTTGLSAIAASGGTPHSLTTLNPQQHERTHRLPSLLPDGKTVLFNVGTLASPEDYDDATIEAVRLDTGERKVVLQGGRMPTYMANGDLLYVRGTVLYAVAFDPRRLEVRGRARPIIDGVLGDPTTGASFFAVSDSGILAYVPGNPSPSARQLAWVEPGGKTTPIDLPPALYTELHLSPDGMRLAFSVVVEGSRNRDVWVADPARGTSSRLTSQGTNWTPIWSPDGQRVFSVSYDGEKNRSTVEVRAADGSGDAARIGVFDGVAFLEDMTPDGKTMFITARPDNDARWRLYQLGSAGGGDSRPVEVPIPTSANVVHAAISPDGRWLAYGRAGKAPAETGDLRSVDGARRRPRPDLPGRRIPAALERRRARSLRPQQQQRALRGAARPRAGADAGTSAPAVDQCPAAGGRIRADLQRRSQKRPHPGDANDRRTPGYAAGALHAERVHWHAPGLAMSWQPLCLRRPGKWHQPDRQRRFTMNRALVVAGLVSPAGRRRLRRATACALSGALADAGSEREGAPSWEILPQAAKPGEVILSKRNELGLLSNFAPTPFTFRGQSYASLEGFWQTTLYPETPTTRARRSRVSSGSTRARRSRK